MDLLASLGLENALPEQSTRLVHPGVISALEKCSAALDNDGDDNGGGNDNNSDDDGQCRLGFNYCLTCGASLTTTKSSHQTTTAADAASASTTTERAKKIITCKGCNRVNYCSELCRRIDAEPQPHQHVTNGDEYEGEGGVDENALGHSPVICSLLNLCNDDELVEDELYDNNNNSDSKLKNDNNNQKYEIAKYRIQTERESYPATLFNMLSDDGPSWLVEALSRRLRYKEEIRSPEGKLFHRSAGGEGGGGDERKKRRGKRDRQSLTSSDEITTPTTTTASLPSKGNKKELVLHIVGAQSDSELWGWDGSSSSTNNNKNEMLDAYAEASSNVLSYLQNFIDVITGIRLVFVGPGCPRQQHQQQRGKDEKKRKRTVFHCEKMIPGSKTMLYIETHCCNYGDDGGSNNNIEAIPPPDAIIFFNPGFSCTDYDWSTALKAAASSSSLHGSSLSSTPFLVTTNTEMEGYADIKCLVDGGYIDSKEIPNGILETFSGDNPSFNDKKYSSHNDDEEEKKFFFCENPYAGLRVRQSGTMANDLYVKSRWVMGGLFVPENKKMVATTLVNKSKSKKKRRKDSEERRSSSDVHRKKKRRKGDGSNPALI